LKPLSQAAQHKVYREHDDVKCITIGGSPPDASAACFLGNSNENTPVTTTRPADTQNATEKACAISVLATTSNLVPSSWAICIAQAGGALPASFASAMAWAAPTTGESLS